MIEGGSIGIDTVRLGGRAVLRSKRLDEGWSLSGCVDPSGETIVRGMMRKLDNGAVLQLMRGQDSWHAFGECSLPKLAGVDNVEPLDLESARRPAAELLAAMDQYVELTQPANVNRLDVARDFTGCENIGPLLLGLSSVPLKGQKSRNLYRDTASGGAQTLFVRNTGGGCRLYDKWEESGLPGSRGRIRCEAQERRRGLRARGVEQWQLLTEENVVDIGFQRYEWAGFDRPVSGVVGAAERLLAATEITDGQRNQALAGVLLAQIGRFDLIGDKSRRSRVRRTLEDVGAFAADGVCETFQFDYFTGLQRAS